MKNNNAKESAIPINEDGELTCIGLTKREYFAGQALQALPNSDKYIATIDDYAKFAVKMADALLEELEKKK